MRVAPGTERRHLDKSGSDKMEGKGKPDPTRSRNRCRSDAVSEYTSAIG